MTGLSTFVFIPLILTALVSAVLVFLVVRLKIRTGKGSLNLILSLGILFIGTVFTLIYYKTNAAYFIFTTTIFLTLLILITHFRLLQTMEHKQEPVIEEKEPEEEIKIPVFQEEDESLLDASYDFIIKASDSFADEAGLKSLLDYVNSNIIDKTKADGGAIMLVDEFDDVISVKSYEGDFPPPYQLPQDLPHKIIRIETSFRFAQFPLTETIFSEVVRSGKAELITDPLNDNRLFQNEPEEFLKLGTYILVPMIVKDTVIGIVALARRFDSTAFSENEFKIAKTLTDFASAAIKNVYSFQEIIEHTELTRESDIACKIQKKLHPKLLPNIPTLSLGSYFNTSEGVCGDYYDILPSRKDRISFVLADVAGKGMNSLIIMVMIRAILRLVVNTKQSASTILSWANRGVCADNTLDHFASLALINYDTTQKKIQFSTAGTTPILLYDNATKKITKISTNSEPIGVEKTTTYADNELTVNSGDILITYTDGLVETLNSTGKQYTAQRLIDVITQSSNLSGKEIANAVKTDIAKFSGSTHQHDDQTLLVIKIQ